MRQTEGPDLSTLACPECEHVGTLYAVWEEHQQGPFYDAQLTKLGTVEWDD